MRNCAGAVQIDSLYYFDTAVVDTEGRLKHTRECSQSHRPIPALKHPTHQPTTSRQVLISETNLHYDGYLHI